MKLSPALAVAREFVRALLDLALLPIRLQDYLARHNALRERLRADLTRRGSDDHGLRDGAGDRPVPKGRVKIFVSCAETSGETHAVSVVRALRAALRRAGSPDPELVGLGGERLAAEGVRLIGRPVDRAAMGFSGVLPSLPYYLKLLSDCARELKEGGCDLFLPVDSPALHVPLAHIARHYDTPTVHFVTPQYWGWAPWRVKGYRNAVDLALSILPFEPDWFERHGVRCEHVGHPLLDTLTDVPTGSESTSRNELVLLPGSRSSVIRQNLPWMLRCVDLVARRVEGLEVTIASSGDRHASLIAEIVARSTLRERVRTRADRLHETLAGARAALSVSGTVLIDLLHQRVPAVTIYRLKGRRGMWMYRNLLTAPYFASVNLLAGREVLPEHCFHGDGPLEQVASELEALLVDENVRATCAKGLDEAALALGPAGAATRAAGAALELLAREPGSPPL